MSRTTNYRQAWNDFRKTKDYKNLSDALQAQGIKMPYRNNIIQNAFSAGWRASGVKIEFIDKNKKS